MKYPTEDKPEVNKGNKEIQINQKKKEEKLPEIRRKCLTSLVMKEMETNQ